MCAMDNKSLGQTTVNYLIKNYKVSVSIIVLCVLVALLFALSRPVVYQSELTFSVDFTEELNEGEKKERLQNISKLITTDLILKSVEKDTVGDEVELLNDKLLFEDYRGCVIRVQNQMFMDTIKLYAHGQTPKEAQNICNGVYEHFKAYSFRLKQDAPETTYIMQKLEHNLNSARLAYDDYCVRNANKLISSENNELYLQKNELYNDIIKWETTYQDFLRENLRQKYKKGYQLNLISEATLPANPVPSRTGFIVGMGLVIGIIVCFAYGIIMVKVKFK